MPDGLITLADLPELAGDDPSPQTTITVARLDDNLRDPRYGRFAITQADVDGWTRNLSDTFGGRVSIDFDHSSDRGKGTKAAAWITGLEQRGKKVQASVEFTPAGARAVREREFLYISPTFVENYKDEHGHGHGKALLGAALTNRPVLRKDMPTLSLSRESFEGVATVSGGKGRKRHARARAHARGELTRLLSAEPVSSDSRGRMSKHVEIAKLLDLPEDADAVTLLAAVAALDAAGRDSDDSQIVAPVVGEKAKKKLGKKGKGKKAKRTMALSAKETAALVTAANAGQAASVQLAEQTFDAEFARTLAEGRIAPAQEDTMRALYRQDAELAIKTLAGMQRIVPMVPRGTGEDNPDAGRAPEGVDQGRHQLDHEARQRAVTLAKEQSISVEEAYVLAAIEIDERNADRAARGF